MNGVVGTNIYSSKWTNDTTFSTDYQAITNVYPLRNPMTWLRIADDGSNRICSWSADGFTWQVLHTIGRTDFLTANEVGFFVDAWNVASPTYDVAMHLIHWSQS